MWLMKGCLSQSFLGHTSVDHSYVRTDIPSPLTVGDFITTHQHGGSFLSVQCKNKPHTLISNFHHVLIDICQLFCMMAVGTWLQTDGAVTANGTTSETFSFADFAGNTYWRDVSATNSRVTWDEQGGSLAATWPGSWPFGGTSQTPEEGSGDFAARLVDQRIYGKTIVW